MPPESTYEQIYRVVRRIPPGRVSTYGRVAEMAGLPGHARMVGYALHALADHSAVPWHRVVNAQGAISARRAAPDGAVTQRIRLEGEGVELDARGHVPLRRFAWEGRPPNPRRAAGVPGDPLARETPERSPDPRGG